VRGKLIWKSNPTLAPFSPYQLYILRFILIFLVFKNYLLPKWENSCISHLHSKLLHKYPKVWRVVGKEICIKKSLNGAIAVFQMIMDVWMNFIWNFTFTPLMPSAINVL
jgi:hypothetical protein